MRNGLNGAARTLWISWPESLLRAAGYLAIGGYGLLFLEAAATVEIVYTVAPSYVLLGLACAMGLPLVLDGWRRLPRFLSLTAAALLVVYAVTAVLFDQEQIAGIERASEVRDLVYVADLALGLGIVGLVTGLVDRFDLQTPLVLAVAVGAGVAALYAVFQWPAQQLEWPLGDVTNAVDSSGVTYGETHQGQAFFGWERVHGTFTEPQQLSLFLASAIAVTLGAVAGRLGTRAIVVLVVIFVAAMVLTSSVPGWIILALSASLGIVIGGARLDRRVRGLVGVFLALSLLVATLIVVQPSAVSAITGRTTNTLEKSADFRLDAWDAAADRWQERPVVGYGPGQSAVQLARFFGEAEDYGLPRETLVLGTAHGVLAAALIEVGLLGALLWVLLWVGAIVVAAKGLVMRPSALGIGVFAGGTAAILAAQIVGDRLEGRAWAFAALMLAVLALPRRAGGQPRLNAP